MTVSNTEEKMMGLLILTVYISVSEKNWLIELGDFFNLAETRHWKETNIYISHIEQKYHQYL